MHKQKNGHPFHRDIGAALWRHFSRRPALTLRRDDACVPPEEKGEQIQLFGVTEFKSRKRPSALCRVDAILLKEHADAEKAVRVIIEIEESGFKPITLCGKCLAAALARSYAKTGEPLVLIPPRSVLFVEIIKVPDSPRNDSAKQEQFAFIKQSLETTLAAMPSSGIKEYRLYTVGAHDKDALDDLIRGIETFIA